jgi:hypothetical protein
LGIFAAINDDNTTVGVGWDVIFSEMGMVFDEISIETSRFEKDRD